MNQALHNYKVATYNALRTTLMDKALEQLDNELGPIFSEATVTGGVLVSDGWSDVKTRPLSSLMFATLPRGVQLTQN